MKTLTFNNSQQRFDIAGDKATFDRIVTDMIDHGGNLAPSSHWNWNLGCSEKDQLSGYNDNLFQERYSQLKMMMDPWVGVTGMQQITTASVSKYETFLRAIDHQEMLPPDTLRHAQANGWLETDLGSVMDINLITGYLRESNKHKLNICEVGGGYGRLAEAWFKVRPENVHYVLVDAVPGSLMYAYIYLKKQLPNLSIGSFYENDPYSDEYNIYIMPAWQTQQLNGASFDICINVESMQEMEQHHVDYYLQLFDRLTRFNGLIYMSNARDYVFKGQWNIPSHWEPLFLGNTPRSWTANHPTQVFRKGSGDFSQEQRMLEGAFGQQIAAWSAQQHINELQLQCTNREHISNTYCKQTERLASDIPRSETGESTRGVLSLMRSVARAAKRNIFPVRKK